MSGGSFSTYRGKRVLVTGHTGFKGSWLCAWLDLLGAKVGGLSNSRPSEPCHHDVLACEATEYDVDIRNAADVLKAISDFKPDAVFHLAAQSLVRPSYADPIETYATNVMGSLHVYDACRRTAGVSAIVSATTDKVYRNREWHWGYRETDELGGHDPYSSSKACAEIMSASYRLSFFGDAPDGAPLMATARAGNVIGGGDWAEDRLVPDIVRAAYAGQTLNIRSPQSVRPWQHVLDPLAGYLMLGERLLNGDRDAADAWNFGPTKRASISVRSIVEQLQTRLPALEVEFATTGNERLHEAGLLELDSSKALSRLNWRPQFEDAMLDRTLDWYEAYYNDGAVKTSHQLEEYMALLAGSD